MVEKIVRANSATREGQSYRVFNKTPKPLSTHIKKT